MEQPLNQESSNSQSRMTKGQKFLHAIDIFAFLPVPKTEEVSTKRSVVGSVSLIVIFLGYLIFSLVSFFTNNPPRINQYSTPLNYNTIITTPDLAIGFLSGKEFNDTSYNRNSSYFDIIGKRKIKYYDIDTQGFSEASRDLYLNDQNPDWIDQDLEIKVPYYEADDPLQMQGLLYTSKIHQFPSFTLYTCRNKTSQTYNCATPDDINRLYAGGRLFSYFKKQASTNYASGKSVDSNDNQFYSFYYFVVPGLYNRAEVVYQLGEVDRYPDYATRFVHQNSETLQIINQYNYVSNVTANDASNNPATTAYMPSQYAFQVWARLDEDVLQNEVVYDTIMDKISNWGAFWGVLFSAFAIYFLRYNKERFYKFNPDWDQFDKKIDQLDHQPQPNSLLQQQNDVEVLGNQSANERRQSNQHSQGDQI